MEKDIALILVGFVVGAMNAIAGGGMLVGFPVLVALGVPPLTANATASVITAPGQLASAVGYWRYLRKVPLRYAWLLLPATIGAALGSLTLRNTSPHDFARLVPALVLFGVLLFVFQPLLHFHLHRQLKGRAKKILPLALLGMAMIPLCFYGGYFGAGYGFLMLAFLGLTNLQDTHMINAMKNVSAVFVSSTAMLCLYGAHLIDWRIGGITAIGTVSGGFLGARGAQHVSSHWLRISIIAIGLMAVIYLSVQQY
ncbi:MAG TPA: sulfite exporter TauE/SafE family protein [Candidatus Saccharimonadales bacterium]|nr:sulfite exporter TauE/SafE family protein [Candidatus Saccharimonadales bacterium]